MRWLFFIYFIAALIGGCADLSDIQMSDDSRVAPPCVDKEKMCLDQSLYICSQGELVKVLECGSGRVCVNELGCVDCDPSSDTACFDNDVHRCDPTGRIGQLTQQCSNGQCHDGACIDGCVPEARPIYVIDDQHQLISFDPAAGENGFKLIKKLSCPVGPPGDNEAEAAVPFSMAVDHQARAWVLYTSGELFWVNTTTGECQASPFQKDQAGFRLFGMGFAADSPGSSNEKLYIAGGPTDLGDNSRTPTAYINPKTLEVSPLGSVDAFGNFPELTGTGRAELFAYFPSVNASFVAQLDKETVQIIQKWPLDSIGTMVKNWAFAQWGGEFYIFITTFNESGEQLANSQVIRLDPITGSHSTILSSLPYRIVGAGVSTCAPYILK